MFHCLCCVVVCAASFLCCSADCGFAFYELFCLLLVGFCLVLVVFLSAFLFTLAVGLCLCMLALMSVYACLCMSAFRCFFLFSLSLLFSSLLFSSSLLFLFLFSSLLFSSLLFSSLLFSSLLCLQLCTGMKHMVLFLTMLSSVCLLSSSLSLLFLAFLVAFSSVPILRSVFACLVGCSLSCLVLSCLVLSCLVLSCLCFFLCLLSVDRMWHLIGVVLLHPLCSSSSSCLVCRGTMCFCFLSLIFMHACIYICTLIDVNLYMRVHTHVCAHSCTHVHAYTYACIHR